MGNVTSEECFQHRAELVKRENEQEIEITEIKATTKILMKIFWINLAAMISGFVGVIIAIITR